MATYKVPSGSNLTASAKAMGITLTQLLDANPQYKANPNMVQAGAALSYPSTQPKVASSSAVPPPTQPTSLSSALGQTNPYAPKTTSPTPAQIVPSGYGTYQTPQGGMSGVLPTAQPSLNQALNIPNQYTTPTQSVAPTPTLTPVKSIFDMPGTSNANSTVPIIGNNNPPLTGPTANQLIQNTEKSITNGPALQNPAPTTNPNQAKIDELTQQKAIYEDQLAALKLIQGGDTGTKIDPGINPNQAKIDELSQQKAIYEDQLAKLKLIQGGDTGTIGVGETDVNATLGTSSNTASQTDYISSQSDKNLYDQVIEALANLKNNKNVENAYGNVYNLMSGLQSGNNAIMTKPIPLEFQQGQMAALQRDYGPQLTAAQGVLTQAITGQQQQLQGLQTAAGMVQPTQLPYSNQLVYPFSGMPVGGTTGTQGTASTILNQLAQQVSSGTSGIDYKTAYNQLSTFGPVVQNALLPAIQKIKPDFNINQAAAQATAQTQNITKAGQVQAAINSVNPVMGVVNGKLSQNALNDTNTLLGAFNALPGYLKTGSSLLNALGNSFAGVTTIDLPKVQSYQRLLADVRSGVNTILQTGRDLGVVTGASSAEAMLPNNMNLTGITQAINQIISIENAVTKALGTPASSIVGGGSTSTGLFNW